MSRYDDALFMQMGACNPTAIAGTLHTHLLDVMRTEPEVDRRKDPALRLITHQLSHIMGVEGIMDSADYTGAIDACLAKAEPKTVELWNRR